MTKGELLARLWEAFLVGEDYEDGGREDPENAHSMADAALLEYINDEEIRAAFDEINKWYA